jgi:hypothetical protein
VVIEVERASIDRPSTAQSPPVAYQLGFWSAVLATLAAVGFPVGLVFTAFAFPAQSWTGDIRAYAATYSSGAMAATVIPSLLIAPAFLGLVAAFHAMTPAAKRPLATLALALANVYATTVGINYFLQLTVVRQSLEAGAIEGMALYAMPNLHSIFWALEFLGYFWQGSAAALIALTLDRGRLQLWIRWLFIVVFVAGALGIVAGIRGVTSFTDPVMIVGSAPWVVAFPLATALCAVHFHRLSGSPCTCTPSCREPIA